MQRVDKAPVASLTATGPCRFCGSTEPRRRDKSCRRCDSPYDLHFGRRYTLEKDDRRWVIYQMHPIEGGRGMRIDRSTAFGTFPLGGAGWEEAWLRFLDLEPNYPRLRRWNRWKPKVGLATFWIVAAALGIAAILTEGSLRAAFFIGLGSCLLLFLVLALGESLPWND